jgi:hypothetical protein
MAEDNDDNDNIDVNNHLNNDGDDDDNDNNDNNNLIDIDDEDDDDLNDNETHIDGGFAVDNHGGSGVTGRQSISETDLVRTDWYIFYVDNVQCCRPSKFFNGGRFIPPLSWNHSLVILSLLIDSFLLL